MKGFRIILKEYAWLSNEQCGTWWLPLYTPLFSLLKFSVRKLTTKRLRLHFFVGKQVNTHGTLSGCETMRNLRNTVLLPTRDKVMIDVVTHCQSVVTMGIFSTDFSDCIPNRFVKNKWTSHNWVCVRSSWRPTTVPPTFTVFQHPFQVYCLYFSISNLYVLSLKVCRWSCTGCRIQLCETGLNRYVCLFWGTHPLKGFCQHLQNPSLIFFFMEKENI